MRCWRVVGCSVRAFRCIDHNQLLGVFVEFSLIVGMCQVQFCDWLPATEWSENILNPGECVGLSLGCLICGQFVVPTDPYRAILLDNRDYGCCPIRRLYLLNHPFFLQMVKFILNLALQCISCFSGLIESWLCLGVHVDICLDSLDSTQLSLQDFCMTTSHHWSGVGMTSLDAGPWASLFPRGLVHSLAPSVDPVPSPVHCRRPWLWLIQLWGRPLPCRWSVSHLTSSLLEHFGLSEVMISGFADNW